MRNVGGPEVMLLLIVLLGALPIWAAIDAAMRPDDAYVAIGQNKVVWVLVSLLAGFIGALIYLIAIRPKLVAAAGPAGLARAPMLGSAGSPSFSAPTVAPPTSAPPGWYPHPSGNGTVGYWDGTAWVNVPAPQA